MKLNNLLLLAGAGIAGFFLFSAFKPKENTLPGSGGTSTRPKIKPEKIPVAYSVPKLGFATRDTNFYDKTTYELLATVPANTQLKLSGEIQASGALYYIHSRGYIKAADVTITGSGGVAITE